MQKTRKLVAFLLTLVMVLSTCVFQTGAETTATPSVKADVCDGKILLTLSGSGDLSQFDFGVIYNEDQVSVESIDWNTEFWKVYGPDGLLSSNDQSDYQYVVFGGVNWGAISYAGAIATITFVAKEGVELVDSLKVVRDSAYWYDLVSSGQSLLEANPTIVAETGVIDVTKNTIEDDVTGEDTDDIEDTDDDDRNDVEDTDDEMTLEEGTYIDAYSSDGKIYVTLSANEDLSAFDYGITYNGDQVSVSSITWDNSFLYKYRTAYGICANADKPEEEYVVVGGTISSEFPYVGNIMTIIFDVKDGITQVDSMKVIEDSAKKYEPGVALDDLGLTAIAETGKIAVNWSAQEEIPSEEPDSDKQNPTVTEAPDVSVPDDEPENPSVTPGDNEEIDTEVALKTRIEDGKLYVTLAVNKDVSIMEYGFTYNPEQIEYIDGAEEWNDEFVRRYSREYIDDVLVSHGGWICGTVKDENWEYVVVGGTTDIDVEDTLYNGSVVTMVFEIQEGVEEIDSIKAVKNASAIINDVEAGELGGTLENSLEEIISINGITPDVETGIIKVNQKPGTEITTEQIPNEDGTVTDKVTETTTTTDGAVTEKVTETTTATNGAVTEKITETVTNADGTQEILSILKELLQIAKDIYEKIVTSEKELADGTKLIKEFIETSKIDDDGNIVKESKVKDEKKNKDGKSVEKYEYDAEVLPEDVEWDTSIMDEKDIKDKHKESLNKKGIKDYEAYDINPKSKGEKVDVKDGKVKVSLECKDDWKDKKVRAYDMENDRWLDAVIEGEYVTFYAEHFSQYAIVATVNYTLGNVDSEGNIELKDAQQALRLALLLVDNPTEEQELAADVDENGAVELKDAQQILRRALLLIEEFEKDQ